ncbi:MAG: heavy-metal-associated domain-containing protein [Sphingomonadales bacterium]
MKLPVRLVRPISFSLLLSLLFGGAVFAQLEGGERGVPPIDSASTYEVTGVDVDVSANTADAARYEGWREAQERAWKVLWAKTNGRPIGEAPNLPDSTLNSIVSAIEVGEEEIGPHRYIATLGVLFDKARAGPMLGGVQGEIRRSAPMLVIPVTLTGSFYESFESRNEWQKAWARFRTGSSPIDYVRPVGNGIDPLLLNGAQSGRPGRGWWRMLLDQYGASDIVVPEVQLKRFYPGGPVIGIFTARHGPDDQVIARFGLRVGRSALIPKLLDEGVRRIDAAYALALADGRLSRDSSLNAPEPVPSATAAEQIEQATAQMAAPETPSGPVPVGTAVTFSVQVDTPTAASVGQAELSVSRIGGVTSAITTSLALGGTSVMRVTFVGDAAALQAALQAQGWTVQASGNTLRISRGAPAPAERQ